MKAISFLFILLTLSGALEAKWLTCYNDVERNFKRINNQPSALYKYSPNKIFGLVEYKLAITNKVGIDNHFQGLSKTDNAYIISGANFKNRSGDIFVLQNDKVVNRVRVASGNNWHIGGIQASGNIVAVSLEPYKVENQQKFSVLQLWDFSNLNNPIQIRESQIKNLPSYTPAAGILRLGNGRYLIGQLSHNFELYLSNSANLRTGIVPNSLRTNRVKIGGTSFSLIRQCDGKVYLITFDNDEGKIPVPVSKGKNYATLYEVGHEESLGKGIVNFRQIDRRFFYCKRKCSFRAGGSVKNLGNGSFSFISTKMFRKYASGKIYIAEFF